MGGCGSVRQCTNVCVYERVCVRIQVDNSCFCSLYRLVFQDSVLSPRLPQVGSSQLQTHSVHCFTVLPPLILWIIFWSDLENVFFSRLKKKKSPLLWIFLYFSTNSLRCAILFRLWGRALFICLSTKLLNCTECVLFFPTTLFKREPGLFCLLV